MSTTIRRAIMLGGAVLAGLLPAGPAHADTDGRFSLGGTECHEAVILFDVDAENVDDFVPEGYEVGTLGAGERRAAANIAALACNRFGVDGAPAGSWRMSSLGVQVRPPDRSYFNNFQIWAPTTNAHVAGRYTALGLRENAFLPDLTIETQLGELGSSSSIDVPLASSPYRFEVETHGPFSPPLARAFTIWAAGTKGNVTIDGQIENERFQFGEGRLTAAPGSPLARIIGGTSVTGSALISTFEFTAVAGPAPTEPSVGS